MSGTPAELGEVVMAKLQTKRWIPSSRSGSRG
jgi:hypothetical protein